MASILLFIGLVLTVSGLVGIVRGRIDTRWFTSRATSLIPLVVGITLLFVTSAPPLHATGAVAEEIDLPPAARSVLESLEPVVKAGTAPATEVFPDQRRSYPHWERQMLKAYAAADKSLRQVPHVVSELNAGRIDRFTAWVRLGILAVDIRQANLTLHDLTPPSLLDLGDRHRLEEGLAELKRSLDLKTNAIRELQHFARSQKAEHLTRAQLDLERGHERMTAGLTKVLQVKARLGV